MMFVGRDGELAVLAAELETCRRTQSGRFLWLRGRRRVGKSRLVQEFCDRAGARYAYFQAPRRDRAEALVEFHEAVRSSTLGAAATFQAASYSTWPAALAAAARDATPDDPAILVIDELPYLVELDAGFAADLQKAWDRALERAPVLLICVGSDVRMMEALVEERSPLHGRPTREMRIAPLSPRAVGEITGAPDASAAFDRHLVVGGFPLLAATWPSGDSLHEFLRKALCDDQTPFVTTALRIMTSEFERDLQARRVLEAIGHGESSHGRIQTRSGIKGNTLSAALEVLIEHKRLVLKELPYAVPPAKMPAKYVIVDPYLRFWLRFVGPHLAELSRGRPDLVLDRIVRDWPTYRGRAIEPLVREALERLLVQSSLRSELGGAQYVGSWWRRDHSVEVDLVGGDALEPSTIGFVGSIKWHDRDPFTRAELRQLAEHRAVVPGAAAAALLVVSRTAPAPGVKPDVLLRPDDLLAAW